MGNCEFGLEFFLNQTFKSLQFEKGVHAALFSMMCGKPSWAGTYHTLAVVVTITNGVRHRKLWHALLQDLLSPHCWKGQSRLLFLLTVLPTFCTLGVAPVSVSIPQLSPQVWYTERICPGSPQSAGGITKAFQGVVNPCLLQACFGMFDF